LPMGSAPRVTFVTLGCKANQYDTRALMARFEDLGYRVVPRDEPADVVVINTCAVTGRSAAKSRQAARREARRRPGATVAVAGCLPQVDPEQAAALNGVAVVGGTSDRDRFVSAVDRARRLGITAADVGKPIVLVSPLDGAPFEEPPRVPPAHRTRVPVKIQDGCDRFCSYCIVPYARGRARSREPSSVVSEVEALARQGVREVVLTGIHLGAYGYDLRCDSRGHGPGRARPGLASIIEELHAIRGLLRIRLSSLEPIDIDDELIDIVAGWPKSCRHLHLPLQSGCDAILERMNRGYTTREFRSLVRRARDMNPDVAITTDVLVGFPGETEEEFQETLDFCEEIGFSRMHVFKYSRRPGTRAARMGGDVPSRTKEERRRRLAALASEMAHAFHQRFAGSTVAVLVEEERDRESGLLHGLTSNYVRVVLEGPDELKGKLIWARILSTGLTCVRGAPVGGAAGATRS